MYIKKHFRILTCFLLIILSAALIISCSQAPKDAVTDEGSLTVFTETETGTETEGPALINEYDEIIINIKEIIAVPESDEEELINIISFTDSEKIINLLDYTNMTAQIGTGIVPAGTYSQIRIVLYGEGNSIKPAESDEAEALSIPSGEQTGIKLVLSEPLTIEEGSSWSMTISWDFTDGSHITQPGGSYKMTPVVNVILKPAAE